MTALVIALTVICVVLCLALWRLYQWMEADRRYFDDPARLQNVLLAMTERVRRESDWKRLEDMRDLVSLALADLDRLRHDTTQQELRESKSGHAPKKSGNSIHIEKLSATQLARRRNTSTAAIQKQLVHLGYIEVRSGLHYFTELGRSVGGDYRKNHPGASDADGHMVWPIDLPLADAISSNGK